MSIKEKLNEIDHKVLRIVGEVSKSHVLCGKKFPKQIAKELGLERHETKQSLWRLWKRGLIWVVGWRESGYDFRLPYPSKIMRVR